MKLILKNIELSFLSTEKKYFYDLIKDIDEFGGGYYPTKAGEETTRSGNIIKTSLESLPLNFQLEHGHTYLIGAKISTPYSSIRTTNAYNYNGVDFSGGYSINTPFIAIVTDSDSTKEFTKFPYLTLFHQDHSTTRSTEYEVYLYDITGEETSKFESMTFDDLRTGKISVNV